MDMIKISTRGSHLVERKESGDPERRVQVPGGQEQVPALVREELWPLSHKDQFHFVFYPLIPV